MLFIWFVAFDIKHLPGCFVSCGKFCSVILASSFACGVPLSQPFTRLNFQHSAQHRDNQGSHPEQPPSPVHSPAGCQTNDGIHRVQKASNHTPSIGMSGQNPQILADQPARTAIHRRRRLDIFIVPAPKITTPHSPTHSATRQRPQPCMPALSDPSPNLDFQPLPSSVSSTKRIHSFSKYSFNLIVSAPFLTRNKYPSWFLLTRICQ